MAKEKPTGTKADRGDLLPADGTLLTARGVRARMALLDAARRLFQGKGYVKTRIADITKEADMALGSFYRYFENKEALLEQFAEDFKREVDGRQARIKATDDDPYGVIHELSAVYWSSCQNHVAELAAIFQASMVDKQFAERWRGIRSQARENMAKTIQSLNEKGLVLNAQADATASALGSMMDYFCYVWLIEGGEAARPSLPDDVAIETMARVIYRTIFAEPEPAAAPQPK